MANETLEQLIKQQEELAARIDAQRKESRAAALLQVQQMCKTYEITATELKGHLKVTRSSGTATKSRSRTKSTSTRKR
jgi:RecB family exonuclease